MNAMSTNYSDDVISCVEIDADDINQVNYESKKYREAINVLKAHLNRRVSVAKSTGASRVIGSNAPVVMHELYDILKDTL
jgi:hypothetical protein